MTIGNAGLMGLSRDRLFDVSGRNLRGATGGTATLTVAASNAAARVKAQADYVCDGVKDEVEINAALAALPAIGGKVALSEGMFNVSGEINVNIDNTTLEGRGNGHPYGGLTIAGGTQIRVKTGFVGSYAIKVKRPTADRALDNATLRDFTIYGSDIASVSGLFWQAARGTIAGLRISDMGVDGCVLQSVALGYPNDVYDNVIRDCKFESCLGRGLVFLTYATDNLIHDCIAVGNTGYGFYCDATSSANSFLGCYVYDGGSIGIQCDNMFDMRFVGCRITTNLGGIYLTASGAGGGGTVISGCSFRDLSDGADNSTDGINISPTVLVRGLVISGCQFLTIGGGYTNPNAWRMRYGINIANSNISGATIGGCSSGYRDATSTFGTAEMNNLGTATRGSFAGSGIGDAPISTVAVPFTDGDTVRRVRVYDSSCLSTSKVSCTVRRPNDASTDYSLSATFERGTQGGTISTSDGGSITAWNSVTTNLVSGTTYPIYDGTHVLRINGSLASKFQSSAAACFTEWNNIGPVTTHYGRLYLYLTEAVAGSPWFVRGRDNGGTKAFVLDLTATPKIRIQDNPGTALTMTTTLPFNQFFRVEWKVISSATVGQVEVKLFLEPFSSTPTETLTSPATWNTRADLDAINIGMINATTNGPWWFDDVAVSFSAYPGPSQSPVDSNDLGYVYHTNVVRVGAGYFDVLMTATDEGLEDVSEIPPNETVQLTYSIGS